MGWMRMGRPQELVLRLSDRFGVDTFIETGTFRGRTAGWAAQFFPCVKTIERSKELYDEAVARHGRLDNVEFLHGDSRELLKGVVPALQRPAIFWLDAHWSGGVTYGENDECPLIEEIAVLRRSPHEHMVLIDDARLFLSPPPRPHRVEAWPTIDRVAEELKAVHPVYMVVVEDVIVVVPHYAREIVAEYCQEVATIRWEERKREPRGGNDGEAGRFGQAKRKVLGVKTDFLRRAKKGLAGRSKAE